MRNVVVLVGRRLVYGVIVLAVVSTAIFAAVNALPGDVATEMLGQDATPETVAALRHELGLDRPLAVRYLDWVAGLAHLDLGRSLSSKREIATMLAPRLANTLFLTSFAATLAVPLALFLGLASVVNGNGRLDRLLNLAMLSTVSLPEFFIAYLLIMLFAVKLRWLPSLGNVAVSDPLGSRLAKTALPALALTVVVVGHMMRMTRASVAAVMQAPYIEMAILKGASRWRVILRHALPNAWSPIINVIVVNLAYLVVGVVVVETVFVYPGLGQTMVDAVQIRDLPVVQACTLIFAATYIVLNLAADIIAILTNPRLRRQR
jgi:peptide/nickel transport system permease protein